MAHPDRLATALEAHRVLLEKWRMAMDLVGPGPVKPHFDDALAAVGGLNAVGAWVDLGSGAGFPGIALASVYADASILLVERRQKRASFLRAVIAAAGLGNATVCEGDADALENTSFQGVISRAYKPPAEFLADAARLLVPGGVAVVMTAGSVPEAPAEFAPGPIARYQIDGKPRAAIQFLRR